MAKPTARPLLCDRWSTSHRGDGLHPGADQRHHLPAEEQPVVAGARTGTSPSRSVGSFLVPTSLTGRLRSVVSPLRARLRCVSWGVVVLETFEIGTAGEHGALGVGQVRRAEQDAILAGAAARELRATGVGDLGARRRSSASVAAEPQLTSMRRRCVMLGGWTRSTTARSPSVIGPRRSMVARVAIPLAVRWSPARAVSRRMRRDNRAAAVRAQRGGWGRTRPSRRGRHRRAHARSLAELTSEANWTPYLPFVFTPTVMVMVEPSRAGRRAGSGREPCRHAPDDGAVVTTASRRPRAARPRRRGRRARSKGW